MYSGSLNSFSPSEVLTYSAIIALSPDDVLTYSEASVGGSGSSYGPIKASASSVTAMCANLSGSGVVELTTHPRFTYLIPVPMLAVAHPESWMGVVECPEYTNIRRWPLAGVPALDFTYASMRYHSPAGVLFDPLAANDPELP